MFRLLSIVLVGAAALGGCRAPQAGALEGPPPRIDRDRVAIVLIDAQPSFVRMMHGPREPVLQRLEQLLLQATITGTPIVATFEVPTGRNGELPERLEAVWPAHGVRHEKRTFDCCREPEIAATLAGLGVDQVVVAGAETDVCVLQSCLGLLEMGFEVFLLEDCVFSNEANVGPALRRLEAAGVVPTTFKTFYFELEVSVDPSALPPEWRERWRAHRERFRSPYGLVPTGTPDPSEGPGESVEPERAP
jgi:nicotinamidase-related amidase